MRVAVIGGGPSGLVTLKYLITAHEFFPYMEPIEAKLFESEGSIGGTFKHRSYEDAEVSVERMSPQPVSFSQKEAFHFGHPLTDFKGGVL